MNKRDEKHLFRTVAVFCLSFVIITVFITTDISVTLWILNQNKKGGNYHGRNQRNREYEILFMDLRLWQKSKNPLSR